MPLSLSKKASLIAQSDIRAMTLECTRLGGINLAQGVCDTEVPLPVRQGVQKGMEAGFNTYTRFDGLAILREAIARKMADYNGLQADPDTEVIVSSGSTGSFYCSCLALLNPGDEVILFEPFYGYHVNILLAVEAVPKYVTMHPPDWTFDPIELERVVTPKTRGIMINTPANPSGKVFSRTELEQIAEFAIRHDLFVFTDEIYEYFLYDGRRHISPATIPGMFERTITISGLSKTFSITGWRIGYSVSHRRWTEMIGYMNDLIYVCAPAPLQYGVAVGLQELSPSFYEGLATEYAIKRDLICNALQKAGLPPHIPQGAYYVLADVSRLPGETGREKAMHLLSKTGVAGVPGEAFFHGAEGSNLIRFCFAKKDEELAEAARRIGKMD